MQKGKHMAEGKKREYKRETATKALTELCVRSYDLNTLFTNRDYPYMIERMYVFGSYLKGKDKVHDLDIAIKLRRLSLDLDDTYIREYHPYGSYKQSYLSWLLSGYGDTLKFLKGGKGIISFHSTDEIDGLLKTNKDAGITEPVLYLVDNSRHTEKAHELRCIALDNGYDPDYLR